MERIINLIRAMVQDLETKGVDPETYDNETTFTIPESNLVVDSIRIYINGVETTSFDADYDMCKVTITASLNPGDSIEIHFSYYPQYSDTELEKYVYASLVHLSVNQACDEDFIVRDSEIYPSPSVRERRLIALISSILIEGNLRSYRTPDFTFTFQSGKNKEEKIRDVIRAYKSRAGIFDSIELETE